MVNNSNLDTVERKIEKQNVGIKTKKVLPMFQLYIKLEIYIVYYESRVKDTYVEPLEHMVLVLRHCRRQIVALKNNVWISSRFKYILPGIVQIINNTVMWDIDMLVDILLIMDKNTTPVSRPPLVPQAYISTKLRPSFCYSYKHSIVARQTPKLLYEAGLTGGTALCF